MDHSELTPTLVPSPHCWCLCRTLAPLYDRNRSSWKPTLGTTHIVVRPHNMSGEGTPSPGLSSAVYTLDKRESGGDCFTTTTDKIADLVGERHGQPLATLVRDGTEPSFQRPTYPTSRDPGEIEIWKMDCAEINREKREFKSSKQAVFGTIVKACDVLSGCPRDQICHC